MFMQIYQAKLQHQSQIQVSLIRMRTTNPWNTLVLYIHTSALNAQLAHMIAMYVTPRVLIGLIAFRCDRKVCFEGYNVAQIPKLTAQRIEYACCYKLCSICVQLQVYDAPPGLMYRSSTLSKATR